MARLWFEDTVKRAEKKIIEQNRKALGQDIDKLSESYAQELVHTPGTVLTKEEIAEIYAATGCIDYTETSIDCDKIYPYHMKWRTANGRCNNKEYPLYGAVGTQMKRLLAPIYEDGISKIRGATQLQAPVLDNLQIGPFSPPTPSPRWVSLNIIQDRKRNDTLHTHMLMQWGQFMDHDLDSMPEYVENDCPHQCFVPESLEGRCAPFPIPYNDIAVEPFADNCLGFRRSLPACEYYEVNEMLPREHFNSITHWIDGSTVYHHEPETQLRLRSGINGKLLVDNVNIPIGNLLLSASNVTPHEHYTPLCSPHGMDKGGLFYCFNSTCTSHEHHIHITCTSHIHYMHITCTPHTYHMHISHAYITCTPHAYHMHTTCTPHAPHMSTASSTLPTSSILNFQNCRHYKAFNATS